MMICSLFQNDILTHSTRKIRLNLLSLTEFCIFPPYSQMLMKLSKCQFSKIKIDSLRAILFQLLFLNISVFVRLEGLSVNNIHSCFLLFLFNVLKILTDGKILINYSKTILIIFQDPSGA